DVVTHLADQPARPDERIEGIANRHLVEAHGDHARGRGRDDQADAIPLGERAEGGLYVGSAEIDRRPIGRESLSAAFVLRLCRTRREHREEGEGDRGGNPHRHLLVVGAALKPGSSADLEPPSGALRITFPSAISTTRWPSTTSPTLTIWSLTMARLPPGNFTMPFTDTGALGGARGAASLPGSRRSGGSTNVKGSRNGSAPSARASIGSVRAAAAKPDFDFFREAARTRSTIRLASSEGSIVVRRNCARTSSARALSARRRRTSAAGAPSEVHRMSLRRSACVTSSAWTPRR